MIVQNVLTTHGKFNKLILNCLCVFLCFMWLWCCYFVLMENIKSSYNLSIFFWMYDKPDLCICLCFWGSLRLTLRDSTVINKITPKKKIHILKAFRKASEGGSLVYHKNIKYIKNYTTPTYILYNFEKTQITMIFSLKNIYLSVTACHRKLRKTIL